MLPPGVDPRKMQQLMRQMGMESRDIPARKVVIETEEGSYVLDDPQVTEIKMQGQASFQIAGEVRFEAHASEGDIEMVMSQAGCGREEAEGALRASNGDIAEAIISLKEKRQ